MAYAQQATAGIIIILLASSAERWRPFRAVPLSIKRKSRATPWLTIICRSTEFVTNAQVNIFFQVKQKLFLSTKMCQYCGNTGLCGLFWGALIIKVWRWGTIFFKAVFKKFRDESNCSVKGGGKKNV